MRRAFADMRWSAPGRMSERIDLYSRPSGSTLREPAAATIVLRIATDMNETSQPQQHPDWCYSAVLYEMNVRQLTREGTLRAAEQRLEFLHEMGIDAVWLMPIYPIGVECRKGSLGSYYSIRDYCAVNEEFGTMEDFDSFVAKVHSLGMKVLLDWVANHTSRDAVWMHDRPLDWYERNEDGTAACRGTGPTRPSSTMPTTTFGAARSRPCASGSSATVSTVSAATWRCSCPSSSGKRCRRCCMPCAPTYSFWPRPRS